jgi:formyl-CoA transferase
MGGLIEHPQLDQRDRWRDIGTEGGPIRAMLPPMTFSDVEMRMGDVPALGAHTDRILGELGWSAEDIATMRDQGVVG